VEGLSTFGQGREIPTGTEIANRERMEEKEAV
jgi:hypothetical protein